MDKPVTKGVKTGSKSYRPLLQLTPIRLWVKKVHPKKKLLYKKTKPVVPRPGLDLPSRSLNKKYVLLEGLLTSKVFPFCSKQSQVIAWDSLFDPAIRRLPLPKAAPASPDVPLWRRWRSESRRAPKRRGIAGV